MMILKIMPEKKIMIRCLYRCLFVAILGFTWSAANAAELAAVLEPLMSEHQGKVAVVIRHLDTGEQFAWRADEVQPTASLIKLPVMVAAYRMADAGQLDLTKSLTLAESDKVPGSGILTDQFSAGVSLSLRDAIRLMIRYSDNTATNLVVDQIGLPTTTAAMQSLGFPETGLNSKVYRGDTSISPERSRLYGLGSTTASETVNLLEKLHAGTIASKESCEAMIGHLVSCDDKVLLHELPKGTKVAHKSGAVSNSRCNAGIVYGPKGPFAICVLTTDNKDRSWDDNNAAQVLIGRIAKIAFDHFNPEWDRHPPSEPAELRIGAFGTRVEFLQRTLNARSQPAPNLGVDGDFGPATESAVRHFQELHGQAATGIADAALWQALGPIVEELPVPEPDVVNAEILPREPMDSLDGPPFVTCKAWLVVNADDGKAVGGYEAETPLHIASTTKMMTAWLVTQLAEQQPAVLDETLTMSGRSDETRGSTADVRAGEMLTVRDALYGLMLPSGNDMSVALAEHFGARLALVVAVAPAVAADNAASKASDDDADEAVTDPLTQFVAAMNAEAARLGMTKTQFSNPHGLSTDTHLSTASDLAVLARTAMKSDLFRHYVSTRQRGATVTGPGGYSRNVMWKNTNQLLAIDGYDGVKTGTTDLAGACLVSTAERDGRRLIVVVLGSAASEARYADSRNLYRWAWRVMKQPIQQ